MNFNNNEVHLGWELLRIGIFTLTTLSKALWPDLYTLDAADAPCDTNM